MVHLCNPLVSYNATTSAAAFLPMIQLGKFETLPSPVQFKGELYTVIELGR